ncbi:MAG: Ribulose-phosphate 3-epimerase [Candidatus Nomurabacteria bacterium GW2011_GWE1_32_28]|uniref:Ribulose-phosphate 3-epimerase n=1 Tax=Candidatus Nomurabacteria bacterium GW2011_GWF1_31_48 TaxID=1618767 RepID=A0A0F9YFI3_9BACT|nr:MAG: Ribulose-phosphate 3-epimerase [Candidatus Nomurabacteria bacterium GW2011_GWF2_30_133]KKP28523.1 MAG: Ribulose-phosphate 3-epimerase [Candidatus Nomurabacteria bacterium GW2011_GWE2_31_40]KKP30118.1 MAG: Ribulose-phosphate 3-epimerase [Candidatus Nomurabacteria bacterium GW2011_GWF1_31_48]KKP34663.1 MAG: Ribulose-phosphate 3-epimerase [Candidatus Nomurabacteria bacterium GW2011_GWE1_32_28]HAS80876.1 hypothetical protein [Candidatus Nomurabacteria bacterium]
MIEIVPAILPKNYEDLKDKIAFVRGIVPIVQIDICDGIFVSSKTWPFDFAFGNTSTEEHFNKILNEKEGMPFWEDIDFELDLMVSDAVKNFDIYTKLGAKRIIFHIESVGNLKEFGDFLEGIDIYIRELMEIGVAINIETPVEGIFPLISNIDFVQCMGINKIGFQGQEFDKKVLDNIKILKEKFPDLVISVDGGVNIETASLLIKAGADRLVAGSSIFNSEDIMETIEEFKNL